MQVRDYFGQEPGKSGRLWPSLQIIRRAIVVALTSDKFGTL